MGKITALLLAVLGGISTSMQPPVNSALSRFIGSLESAFVSFMVGALSLLVLVLLFGKGDLSKLNQAPLYLLSGGLLGVVMVTVSILAVGKIGATGLMAAVFIGQIIGAIIIDSLGLFGMPKQGLNWQRLVGLIILFIGTKLVLTKK
ncbi:MAG TPA: DMT family transporter [Clostridia bacterium]|nr:DMT family transporter [Clostridia bacterium]